MSRDQYEYRTVRTDATDRAVAWPAESLEDAMRIAAQPLSYGDTWIERRLVVEPSPWERVDIAAGSGPSTPPTVFDPLGGATRGVGRCVCLAGRGTNPACPIHP